MKNKLIPIYREKELYTFFYDPDKNHLYRFQHRKKSSGMNFFLLLAVLYGSRYADRIYQSYKGPLVDVVLFTIVLVISYFMAIYFYEKFYIQEKSPKIFLGKESLENYAAKGISQLRTELYLGATLSLLLTIGGFVLFFVFSHFELLVIGCLGSLAIFIFLLMRPFTRIKILRQFQKGEIEL
ncbi:hypothetical protein QGM71_16965 [Virgibacillus sp. C22-A2]|uniref:ABC transporter permease n=1 Tax=Virgibacillus tibetensis TaxID=3042313 RepID=A0ABU6KL92_9BACI|nr:hypothetical protein [Virgibacillus sp. C22-A2]